MRKLCVLLFLLLITVMLFAVNGEWKIASAMNLQVNISNYSTNWAGEEVSSWNWSMTSNSSFENQITNFLNTSNTVVLSFGQSSFKEAVSNSWTAPVKSSDKIDIESINKLTFGRLVDPFAGLRFESSFLDQRDTLKNCYVNPIKLTESFGIARKFIDFKKTVLTSRIGGAFKQMIDRNVLTLTGTETDITNNGGLEFVTEFVTPILTESITYSTKLTLYKALFYSESASLVGTPQENDWKQIDVYWDNVINAKVTEMISMNFNAQVLYDKEIDSGMRHMEVLSAGLTYKFM